MKYILFAATTILIALSSEAQAPTGITSIRSDYGVVKTRHALSFTGLEGLRVQCTDSESLDETMCAIMIDREGLRRIIGAPNQK
jgi:hypothetical protein